ncbi:MAG: hypothetical protein JSS69_07565 [Acidobacteria bacterium]|nr:hypothetical protein [Acidobacteriota bacterium]MBS1865761.1 hypothetical protein [Acidobacteriota bacterium]
MPDTKPKEQVPPDVQAQAQTSDTGSAPTAQPPASVLVAAGAVAATADGGVTATTWLNNQKVTALWGIAENRNSWMALSGPGWVKLANNSDTAVVALTKLASHAKELQTIVNCRQEADGMIHEIYAW